MTKADVQKEIDYLKEEIVDHEKQIKLIEAKMHGLLILKKELKS